MTNEIRVQTLKFCNHNAQTFFNNTFNLDLSKFYQPFLAILPVNAHILDAGCGSGRDSRYFLEQGYKVTAFDGSEAMVDLASVHIGQPVLHLFFQDVNFKEIFDGIWASASLLHVPETEIDEVITRLSNALKPGGAFYLSFKYGDKQVVRDGRLFNYYNEALFTKLVDAHPELTLAEQWRNADTRAERAGEYWLNSILTKRQEF